MTGGITVVLFLRRSGTIMKILKIITVGSKAGKCCFSITKIKWKLRSCRNIWIYYWDFQKFSQHVVNSNRKLNFHLQNPETTQSQENKSLVTFNLNSFFILTESLSAVTLRRVQLARPWQRRTARAAAAVSFNQFRSVTDCACVSASVTRAPTEMMEWSGGWREGRGNT